MPPTPKKRPPTRKAAQKPARPTTKKPAITADDCFGDLTETEVQYGHFIMFYSEVGEGKTTLAAQFEKPLFVQTAGEQGAIIHRQSGQIDNAISIVNLEPLYSPENIPSHGGHPGWLKCMETMKRFATKKHDRKTLVIDGVSGLQELCFQHCASLHYNGDINSKGKDGFQSYHTGHRIAAENYWSAEFMQACLEIVRRGYNVILLAHSTFKTVDNPIGENFDMARPALHKQVLEFTKKDLHGIFYLGRNVSVVIDEKSKKKTTVGADRFVGLSPSQWYMAKSWGNHPQHDEVKCGKSAAETYKNLVGVLNF